MYERHNGFFARRLFPIALLFDMFVTFFLAVIFLL